MPCTSRNCSFSESFTDSIMCSMCERIKHIKCTSLKGRVADLVNANASVKWFCEDCLAINVGLCSALRQTRQMFAQTSKELKAIQERLAAYEELFSSAKLLEVVNCVNKAPSTQCNSLTLPLPTLPPVDDNLIALSPHPFSSPDVIFVEQPVALQQPAKKNSKTSSVTSGESASKGAKKAAAKPAAKAAAKTAAKTAPKIDAAPQNETSNPEVLISSNNVPVLKVVKNPLKSIFLSRLSEDTSEEDIFQYISSKVSKLTKSECKIRKFKYSCGNIFITIRSTRQPILNRCINHCMSKIQSCACLVMYQVVFDSL